MKLDKSFFDGNSFIISLECNAKDFYQDFYNLKENYVSSRLIKSFLHEYTHYIQLSTTTVGYYLKLLKNYQQIRMMLCCTDVLNTRPKKLYPLFYNIMDLKNSRTKNKKASYQYYYWVLSEIVRLFILGDSDTLSYYQHYMMDGMGFLDYFLELDEELKRFYQLEPDSFKYSEFSDEVKDKMSLGFMLSEMSNISIASLIESEALLSEYYFDEVADERLLSLLKMEHLGKEECNYFLPLILYRSTYGFDLKCRKDFSRFKLGFHGICQIVLHSPILPFQGGKKEKGMVDIELNAKFMMLLLFREVEPPELESDYVRYLHELEKRFQFITMDESYSYISNYGRNIMSKFSETCTIKEIIFVNAQKKYNDDPLNYYKYLSSLYFEIDAFYLTFRDRDLESSFLNIDLLFSNLVEQYFRELMYGYSLKNSSKNILVKTPVKVTKRTLVNLEYCAKKFNKILSTSFLDKFPQMIIMNTL